MDSIQIIEAIDEEIANLRQVRSLLAGGSEGHGPSTVFNYGVKRPGRPRKKRVLSAEARARIAAAQKRRWAKQKAAAKK